MGHDRGDAAHRARLARHKGLERQHRGARPDLPVLLDYVDLLEVEPGVLSGIEVLLPIGDAAPEGRHPNARQRIHVPFTVPA